MSPQTPPNSTASRTYADSVADYALAGWTCILPVPPATKTPPPQGYTGDEGRDTDPVTLVQWAASHGDWSVALRMPILPDGQGGYWAVIGIDVDQYTKERSPSTAPRPWPIFEQVWGPLPANWTSTARGDGPGALSLHRARSGGADGPIGFYRRPSRPCSHGRHTVKENLMKKLAALASLALATAGLVAASPATPADAIVRDSIPTTFTLDHSVTTFAKNGRFVPIQGNLMGANGKVPDSASVICDGYRVEGWFGTIKIGGGPVDPVTGDFTIDFYTPATGHYVWECGWRNNYTWTAYQGSGDTITLNITPSAQPS